jgi:hypothetical protein
MKNLSPQQIISYGLVAAILIAIPWILFVTPPCNGDYKFTIGGEKYFLFECVGSDPCKELKCLNGGKCDSGECDCPKGYSGKYCGDVGDNVLEWGSSRGGIKLNDRTISRSGSDWTADIVSKNYLPANKAGVIVHTVTNATGEYTFGFNRQRSSALATDIDFGIYFAQEGPGNVKMAMHDASTLQKIATASRGDTIRMEKHKDGTVVFLRNGSEFHRLPGANDSCLFLDLKIKNMTLQSTDFSLEGDWHKGSRDGCL